VQTGAEWETQTDIFANSVGIEGLLTLWRINGSQFTLWQGYKQAESQHGGGA
jgi:hypothetical protein